MGLTRAHRQATNRQDRFGRRSSVKGTDFEARLLRRAMEVEALLDSLLSHHALAGEIDRPTRLLNAMRHGVLNGGKRLRPFLLLEAAELVGAEMDCALRAAAAIELVHCYSLIHDDLPAMDDDDLRRGQPTVHRAFDEATAILAGDSLLTLAFDVLADPATHADGETRAQLVLCLARASGPGGMAGGQMLDLEAEHRQLDGGQITVLQAMKTGALIRAACEMGAISGSADDGKRMRLRAFGEIAGKAFQLADDILDVTQTSAVLGKQAAKDEERGKATLVSIHGVEKARQMADDLVRQAIGILEPFGPRAAWLAEAARFIARRDH
jgi:farnesyl diphosphate synthase